MSKRLWLLLVICLLAEQIGAKRSGGLGFGRGSSVARSSPISRGGGTSGGFGRSSSGGFGGIGGFGGGSRPPVKSGNTFGRTTGGIGGFGSGGSSWGRNKGGFGNSRGSFPSSSTSRFRSGSGIGSALRSNTFKNVIVGAAAGYLAYQGGKYLIRSAMAPMMWNNRPYYWGSNYYQPRPNTQMCRMPMQQSDPQFGNIYFSDQSRPREIVWGCGYNEVCCGYECCPAGGMGMGAGMGGGMGGGMAPAIGGGAMAGGMMGNTGDAGGGLSVRPAQSIGVRGQLRCNGMPAAGVLVKLYDHDTFTLDDKIASGRSDAQGNFLIAGHANEFTRITPKFNVYHDCNDFLPCQRKISIYIPKHFITEGAMAQKIYDAGQMELSGHFEGESRDCLHK